MPGVDYWAVREAVKTTLTATQELQGATVRIEEEMLFTPELVPYIGIYLDRRDAVDTEQRLAGGTRTDYRLSLLLWCVHFSMDSLQQAVQWRDELVSSVEVALMRNRTLNGAVRYSWLTGGELFNSRNGDNGFISVAEVNLIAQIVTDTR